MRLNNKGWGLGTFILYLGVFGLFIGIVTTLALTNADKIKPNRNTNVANKNTNEENTNVEMNYEEIETNLKNAAYQYQQEYLPSLNNGDIKYVTASKLEDLKFLDNLTNGDILCTGYAKITYENNKSGIMSFINCGDYITEGYNEELDK